MLMRLDLAPITEAAGLVGEDREDIKFPLHLFLLKTPKRYITPKNH